MLALGLMSGTSADGVDGALIYTDGETVFELGPTHYVPYSEALKSKVRAAYGRPFRDKPEDLVQEVMSVHGECAKILLAQAQDPVDLIGLHGQSLFHNPPETYILEDGASLAQTLGIPVIDQLRLNDLAQGGQGAPLVPVFHQALARQLRKPVGILNIGGVANVTWIGSGDQDLLAFDVGPGSGLIDDWVRTHTSLPWDEGGKIAARGHLNSDCLDAWCSHPYFSNLPPKALDRLTFKECLKDVESLSFEDGVATLTAFTAEAFGKALEHLPQKPDLWIACGGGVHNKTLLLALQEKAQVPFKSATEIGWNPDFIEAQAWGFLGVRSLRGLPLSFRGTTGVPGPCKGGRLSCP